MKSIVKYITLSFLLSGIISNSSPQRSNWIKMDSPVNVHLRNLTFADSITGWAAGASGTIIHTTDGGITWGIQNSNVTSFITDIFFSNKYLGWAVTVKDVPPFNTVILKTSDGGNNWITSDFPDFNSYMTTIMFLDSLNGFMGYSYISKTTDGGETWIRADIDSSLVSNYPVYKFRFFNDKLGYATGGFIDQAGVIWRTTNGGLNWAAFGLSPDEIFDIHIVDSSNAIALSGDPEGFYSTGKITTTDAGINWNYEELPIYILSYAIDFRTADEGWSASGYKFLKTTNRGISWTAEDTPAGVTVYDLEFVDKYHGYAVGENGAILKFDPRPLNIKEEAQEIPDEFILNQNFPNPFNPSTEISFKLPADSYVSLVVYDMLGQKVSELINKEILSGEHIITFSDPDLKSGIYFYTIKADGITAIRSFTQTKKMILIK